LPHMCLGRAHSDERALRSSAPLHASPEACPEGIVDIIRLRRMTLAGPCPRARLKTAADLCRQLDRRMLARHLQTAIRRRGERERMTNHGEEADIWNGTTKARERPSRV